MSNASADDAHVAALESALVNEFRAYQSLVALTRDERRALASSDFKTLSDVLTRKEAWLRLLGRMEDSRRAAIEDWARDSAFNSNSPTLAERLLNVSGFGDRLQPLQHGIGALADELRELNRGNRALAGSALSRVEVVRGFLLSVANVGEGRQAFSAPLLSEDYG
ncbi:MAG: flagellar protein FlgN [Anaerolineales bacterium]